MEHSDNAPRLEAAPAITDTEPRIEALLEQHECAGTRRRRRDRVTKAQARLRITAVRLAGAVGGLTLATLLAACALEVGAKGGDGGAATTTQTAVPAATAPAAKRSAKPAPVAASAGLVDGAAAAGEDGACRPPRVKIAAIDIPAVHAESVRVPDQTLAGHLVPGFVIEDVNVAAQHVPASCTLLEPAPAGCLGAVTIPAREIPARTIPAVTIPGVDVPGGHLDAEHEPAVTEAAVREETVTTPRECAQAVRPGEFRPSVFQPSTFASSLFQPSLFRPPLFRPSLCVNGDCIPSVNVPSVSAPSAGAPSVSVGARSLRARTLPEVTSPCVRVLTGDRSTAYEVCADVLFAFNRATIRSQAARVLGEIAGSLRRRAANRSIRVDGHTDAVGSAAYNRRLSLRRAQAVRRWLVTRGRISASRIAVRGYGERRPVAANASASGRKRNRRVVVGVD
jgi:flagellar motor protein MotB